MKYVKSNMASETIGVLFLIFLFSVTPYLQAKIKVLKPKANKVYYLSENQELSIKVYSTKKNGRVKLYLKGNGRFKVAKNFKKAVKAKYKLKDSEKLPYLGIQTIKLKAYEYIKNSKGKYKKQKKRLKKSIQVAYKIINKESQVQAAACSSGQVKTVCYDLKTNDNLVAFPFELFPSINETAAAILSENFQVLNYWNTGEQIWKPLLPDYPTALPFPVDPWKCFFVQMKRPYEWTYTQSVTLERDPDFIIELNEGENFIAIPDVEVFPTAGDLRQSIISQSDTEASVEVMSWSNSEGVWVRYNDTNALSLGAGYAIVTSCEIAWKPYLGFQPSSPYIPDAVKLTNVEAKLIVLTEKLQILKDFVESKNLLEMLVNDLEDLTSVSGIAELMMLPNLYEKYMNLPYLNELKDKIWDFYYAGCAVSSCLSSILDDLRFDKALYETEGGKQFLILIGEIWNMQEVQKILPMYPEIKDEIVELAGYGEILAELGLISYNSVELLIELSEYIEELEILQENNDLDGIRNLIVELRDKYNV
ncbi:MAG: hypothetical protein P9M03_02430 [Candidatus Theseobacter exili]|nr:hypothetical protein [Candidatus Theseobacter exili]